MAISFYKDHTIITSATPDRETGKFIPLASLRWDATDRSRRVQILTPRKLYFTRDAALEVALQEALLWIDLQSAAAQTRAQIEPITTRVTFGEAALQRTHVYKESAAQRELVYPAKLNIRA
jgi:hypothetical protein